MSMPSRISGFQSWFGGEIFVDAVALVPNARRGGFEEDGVRKKIKEIAVFPTDPLCGKALTGNSTSSIGVNTTAAALHTIEAPDLYAADWWSFSARSTADEEEPGQGCLSNAFRVAKDRGVVLCVPSSCRQSHLYLAHPLAS